MSIIRCNSFWSYISEHFSTTNDIALRSSGTYTPSKKCRRLFLFAVVSDPRLARSTHCLEDFRQQSILKYDCQTRCVKDERCRLNLKKDPLNEPRFSSRHRSSRFRHHGPLVVCQNRNYTALSGLCCDHVHIPATADLVSYISSKSSLRLLFFRVNISFQEQEKSRPMKTRLKMKNILMPTIFLVVHPLVVLASPSSGKPKTTLFHRVSFRH